MKSPNALVLLAKEIHGMLSVMKTPRSDVLAACALLLGIESGDSLDTERAVSSLVTVIWAGVEMRTGSERKPHGARRPAELVNLMPDEDEAVKEAAQRIMNAKLLPAIRHEPLGALVLSLAMMLVDAARESKWTKEDLAEFVGHIFDGHKALDALVASQTSDLGVRRR
jgi:hypothetical protein